ncbi:MAG: hypothetical protein NTX72_01595 [Candidatus Uhrbacteria bacterium]|nr:hypothetical protein [Candidatus Uhrbacteria bacterium]
MPITDDMRKNKWKYAFGSFVMCILCLLGIWFGFHVRTSLFLGAFLIWILACSLLFLIAGATWIFYLGLILKR